VRESKTREIATSVHRSSPGADSLLLPRYRAGSIWRSTLFGRMAPTPSVTLNVPPASSINIDAPLIPTLPALSPNGAGDHRHRLARSGRVRDGALEKPSRGKAPRLLIRSMPGPPSLLLDLPQLPQDSASGAGRSLNTISQMLV